MNKFAPAALALLLGGTAAPAEPKIRLDGAIDGKSAVAVEVGLDRDVLDTLARVRLRPEFWPTVLRVTTAGPGERPAMLGEHRVRDGVLRFEPRFPLARGVRYLATFDPARLPGGKGEQVRVEFFEPRPPIAATTTVTRVFPSSDRLPENQLKFYLHFSAPMGRGDAYRYVRLLGADGKPVPRPFLELGEELWDLEAKRFTLFIDPGRIKRGLQPREELGAVLEAGKTYALAIDAAWPDAEGNPLKAPVRKTFRVTAPLEELVVPKAWKITKPKAGTVEPLVVTFPRPLDHALQQRMLWVADAAGRRIPGELRVGDAETRWRFTPDKPWKAGPYQLVADTALEDLAGNSILKPFEVDLFRRVANKPDVELTTRPFDID